MVEQTIEMEKVSAETYMEEYAEQHYEWVRGELIKMSPVSFTHDKIMKYLRYLIDTYFVLNPIGLTVIDPFVMRIDVTESRRQPDLQIILDTNPGELTETAMIGAADICIEIVSKGSVKIDYGDKLEEYEKAGVREYWIIDPDRRAALFYRLTDAGGYVLQQVTNDIYETPLLERFRLHVPTLWTDDLPDPVRVVEQVKGWFADPSV